MKILVVDDEKLLVKGIKFNLENEGYTVDACYDGESAVNMARTGGYDLIILDLMMPKKDGLEACQEIRGFSTVPIIMLTARSEDADMLMGFESGADDYVTKPFSPQELAARVRSQLRRYTRLGDVHGEARQDEIVNGRLVYRPGDLVLAADGEPVRLTATETRIVDLLMRNLGRIFPAEEIYRRVWEGECYAPENTVMVHIRRIREKIELNPRQPEYLKVVWGIGYKMEKKT